jgi:hypothetical protein
MKGIAVMSLIHNLGSHVDVLVLILPERWTRTFQP